MGSVYSEKSKVLCEGKVNVFDNGEKSLSRQSSFKSFMAYKTKLNHLKIPDTNRYSLSLDSDGKSNYQFKLGYLFTRENGIEEPDDTNSESQNSSRVNNIEDQDDEDMEAMVSFYLRNN